VADYWDELGFDIIHMPNLDFFKIELPPCNETNGMIFITNPPFSKLREVLQKLADSPQVES
jgi:hypothetical protein